MSDDFNVDEDSYVEFKDPIGEVFDRDWLDSAFMVSLGKLQDEGKANLFFTMADRMMTDSTLGGSIELNPEYQFTRYADPPRQGRRFDNAEDGIFGPMDYYVDSDGMNVGGYKLGNGRYFSDAIARNRETLILEFGVPQFRSMLSYYLRASDYQKTIIANEGRDPFWYEAGEYLGYLGQIMTLNIYTVLFYAASFIKKSFFGNEDLRYYHFKPMMPDYWASVNSIVTYLATERGVMIPQLMTDQAQRDRIGMPLKVQQSTLDDLHELMPDVFTNTNYIDVFAIAQKTQVEVNRQVLREMKAFREMRLSKSQILGALNEKTGKLKKDINYEKYIEGLKKIKIYNSKRQEEQDLPKAETASGDPKDYTIPDKLWTYLKLPIEKMFNYLGDLTEYTGASIKDGGMSVAFNVEYVSSTSITFTNSVKDIPAQEKFNSLGGAARDIRFNFAGGNIIDDTVNDVTNAIKDMASGTLDTVTFGLSNVLMSLMNGGFMSFPKMWSDSSISLPSITYKIVATPPYNNPISQILDMDIVLGAILAGMLPQATGNSTYTSPKLCRAFLRGKQNIDLGMITSCTIRHGVNNVGYSIDGKTLGLEISFTITDLNPLLAAPVKSNLLGAFDIGLDESNPLNKYLSTLAGRDYHTTRYIARNGLLELSRSVMGLNALTSPAYIAMLGGNSTLGRVSSVLSGAVLDTTGLYLRDKD